MIALIVAVTVLAYLPAMRGGMLWDDDGHVTRPELRSLGGLYRIWFELGATQQYYPLLHSLFWVEHRMWGDAVVGYHLANVLLHAAAACLVFMVLQRLNVPGAALAAAIFAVHPVEVESVAWISEQKNTLSAVFYLSAMWAYLKYDAERGAGSTEQGVEGRGRRAEGGAAKWHLLALLLFTLGLMTKTVTATLPAALLVIFWWQRGRLSWRQDVLPLVPFFLLGAVAGGLTAWVERKVIGAEGLAFELSFWQRGLIAGRAIWFYLGNLVWPANLVFVYPRWNVDPTVWWQWLFPLAAVATTAALWAARKRSRAPLAAWLFFVGTLFPALGFLNVYPFVFSFVADHFQYLAGLGVIVLAAAALTIYADRLPAGAQRAGHLACAALVILLAVLTMFQSSIYGNVEALYRTTIERNPQCWMACNNLGAYLMDHDREDQAEPLLHQAIALRSNYPEALMNLGVHFSHLGRPETAIDLYQQALAARPGDAEAENNWANALVVLQRPREAIEHYQRAAQLKPNYFLASYNLANTLRDLDDVPGAIERYQEALRIKPDFPEAHYNLGIVLAKADRLPEAIEEFRTAIQLRPEFAGAHHNLGVALAASGRHEAAIDEYQEAIRVDDNCFEAYGDLAREFARSGKAEEAVATALQAKAAAQAAGQVELANKVDDWLTKYRASQAAPAGEANKPGSE